MVINVTQEDVIDYYGTWFRFNHGGLVAIFVDPTYNFGWFKFRSWWWSWHWFDWNYGGGCASYGQVKTFDELKSSSVPLGGALTHLHHITQKIAK